MRGRRTGYCGCMRRRPDSGERRAHARYNEHGCRSRCRSARTCRRTRGRSRDWRCGPGTCRCLRRRCEGGCRRRRRICGWRTHDCRQWFRSGRVWLRGACAYRCRRDTAGSRPERWNSGWLGGHRRLRGRRRGPFRLRAARRRGLWCRHGCGRGAGRRGRRVRRRNRHGVRGRYAGVRGCRGVARMALHRCWFRRVPHGRQIG